MSRKYLGNNCEKRWDFRRWRNVGATSNYSADVTSAGKSFQIRGPTSGKARSATVDSLTGGTTKLAKKQAT